MKKLSFSLMVAIAATVLLLAGCVTAPDFKSSIGFEGPYLIETGRFPPGGGNLIINSTRHDLYIEVSGALVVTQDKKTKALSPVVIHPGESHMVAMAFNSQSLPVRLLADRPVGPSAYALRTLYFYPNPWGYGGNYTSPVGSWQVQESDLVKVGADY